MLLVRTGIMDDDSMMIAEVVDDVIDGDLPLDEDSMSIVENEGVETELLTVGDGDGDGRRLEDVERGRENDDDNDDDDDDAIAEDDSVALLLEYVGIIDDDSMMIDEAEEVIDDSLDDAIDASLDDDPL
jgi:hypothetical protein